MLIIKWISSLALKNEWLCCANKLINYKLNFHLLWNCCFTGKKLKSLDKCAFFSTGQVASLTETCLMDRMLGSCSGHHRLWPLTSPLFQFQHQSDCFIMSHLFYPKTVQFTCCDSGTLKSLPTVGWQWLPPLIPQYGSFWWKASPRRCGLYRTGFQKPFILLIREF